MKRKRLIYIYAVGDYLTAMLSWALFFLYRKIYIEHHHIDEGLSQLLDTNFWLGILIIPLCWMLAYLMVGFYKDIYRKSRLTEVWKTFLTSLIGCIILFFALILDDVIISYKSYYHSFLALFIFHFNLTLIWRLTLNTNAKHQLKNRIVSFNTLIIGGNQKAVELYMEVETREKSLGYNFVGFIEINGNGSNGLEKHISKLGTLADLNQIIQDKQIEEVIIAIESSEHDKINEIINNLNSKTLLIKIIPDIYDILTGSVRINDVLGASLIEIYPDIMPTWQKGIKRLLDVFVSLMVLIFLSPLYLFIALRVRLSSKGSIIFKQDRIGLHGKTFIMYKFRSMVADAEIEGPALSTDDDTRITNFGKVLRKWRLDEIPQFYNVIKGDMSIVGPRPERQFYIDQIIKEAAHFKHLQKVKPGITSLGQVKFGYASNVSEMLKRMKYDILYMENMSLALDLKIILFTILTIMQGKGK